MGIVRDGNCPGGNCPGGNCPRWESFVHQKGLTNGYIRVTFFKFLNKISTKNKNLYFSKFPDWKILPKLLSRGVGIRMSWVEKN